MSPSQELTGWNLTRSGDDAGLFGRDDVVSVVMPVKRNLEEVSVASSPLRTEGPVLTRRQVHEVAVPVPFVFFDVHKKLVVVVANSDVLHIQHLGVPVGVDVYVVGFLVAKPVQCGLLGVWYSISSASRSRSTRVGGGAGGHCCVHVGEALVLEAESGVARHGGGRRVVEESQGC
ncbi:hypothetical protein N658DRAFT_489053 [Parathielavia hyrcaniae]|uniref:Uncharacterized protein n=1 Tax=Parathielavia hyrcaniae TaxID=113614 RepID=A0AAN6PTR0_9PEZI|nr:hypothetical protein N658DRAFT_489053 [Parathielavia hyrcaniae]